MDRPGCRYVDGEDGDGMKTEGGGMAVGSAKVGDGPKPIPIPYSLTRFIELISKMLMK
ncbi:hypothetical protein Hanom_Chr13g01214471 [Helianthus anomalus]